MSGDKHQLTTHCFHRLYTIECGSVEITPQSLATFFDTWNQIGQSKYSLSTFSELSKKWKNGIFWPLKQLKDGLNSGLWWCCCERDIPVAQRNHSSTSWLASRLVPTKKSGELSKLQLGPTSIQRKAIPRIPTNMPSRHSPNRIPAFLVSAVATRGQEKHPHHWNWKVISSREQRWFIIINLWRWMCEFFWNEILVKSMRRFVRVCFDTK